MIMNAIKKMINKIYCVRLCVLMLLCLVFITSVGFDKVVVIAKNNNNIVYEVVKSQKLLSALDSKKIAKELYDGKYFAVIGKISKIKDNLKEIEIKGTSNATIICDTSNKNVKQFVSNHKVNEEVTIYGKVDVGSKKIEIDVDRIGPMLADDVLFSMLDGSVKRNQDIVVETLNNKKIKYYIPVEWNTIEVKQDIIESGVGTIEGYQYNLNKINHNTQEPEILFVCYLDSKKLENPHDMKNVEAVEKTMIANILKGDKKKVGLFDIKSINTYYGKKYDCFSGTYRKKEGRGYHTDFAFQKYEDGIVMILYVYKDETDCLRDVSFVMRMFDENL